MCNCSSQSCRIIDNFEVCEECGECSENLFSSFIEKDIPFYCSNISSKDKNLKAFQQDLEKLTVPKNVHFDSIRFYDEVYKTLSIKSNNKRFGVRRGLKCACFYFACKLNKFAKEKKEVAKIFEMDLKSLNKSCNYVIDVMGSEFMKMKIESPLDYLDSYLSILDLPAKHKVPLVEIVLKIMNHNKFMHESTSNILCTAIYMYNLNVLNSKNLLNDIVHKCNISLVTLKRNFSIILE